jgi:argininosuccinate lyase
MYLAASLGFPTATDLADYLVRKGVPFREAHNTVGNIVAFALTEKKDLNQISISQLRKFSLVIEKDVFAVLSLEGSVESRNHYGGTAPPRVREAAELAREVLRNRE